MMNKRRTKKAIRKYLTGLRLTSFELAVVESNFSPVEKRFLRAARSIAEVMRPLIKKATSEIDKFAVEFKKKLEALRERTPDTL
jgi:hypothetical protein